MKQTTGKNNGKTVRDFINAYIMNSGRDLTVNDVSAIAEALRLEAGKLDSLIELIQDMGCVITEDDGDSIISDDRVRADDTEYVDIVNQYMYEVGQYPCLSAEEEYEIALLAKQGDRSATERLVQCSLRLVISIAKRYVNTTSNLTLLDLIQEGNMGLQKAAARFDCERGFKFSTYATWWIRQAITRAISGSGMIRVPVYINDKLNVVRRVSERLRKENCCEPTIAEIAAQIPELTYQQVQELITINSAAISLDGPSSNEDDTTIGDRLPDADVAPIYHDIEHSQLHVELEQALNHLSTRDADIIRKRFGLTADGKVHTLEEVGLEMNITRERVRQLERKALRILSQPQHCGCLREYLAS
ncbi:MAG: sigma-70 family RNA polymerase sigma factor [Ruminococcaceae bacterium]|nr:sigma-70 family RNA polymerase sigma factor [Oscillospiraceae bacterium]